MAVPENHTSHLVAEISTGAIEHNLRLLRDRIGPGCQLWPVVKADAYGLGLERLWPVLDAGSEGLCVSNAREALDLRQWGYSGPLLVLFSVDALPPTGPGTEAVLGLLETEVELTVASRAGVDRLSAGASEAGSKARLHLEVDTGMHRGGVEPDQASELVQAIARDPRLELAGVYTHFATAEEAGSSFLQQQVARFSAWLASAELDSGVVCHAANSAAALMAPESRFGAVRPGLAVYGYRSANDVEALAELRPSVRLLSYLMQTKSISGGEACGYGLTFRFERDSRVGLVPIGYADGYLRSLGNRASMRIRGRDVMVRGTVSMDQVIVDLTEVADACVGDPVEVISPDYSAANSLEALALLAGTIPYEVLTRLGQRIERRLVA